MKTFKIFSMAALALLMAACSEFQQPAEGPMHFKATIAAPNSGIMTRTTASKDGDNYNVAWKVGDRIALVYEDSNGDRQKDEAEVTAVDGSGNATISATLSGPVDVITAVTLVYPCDIVYDTVDDPTGKNYLIDDRYFSQNVTSIEDALPTLDWREGSAYFAVGKSEIGLNSSVTMNPQVAIWKLNLTVGSIPFTAASLEGPGGKAYFSGSSVIFFVPIPYFYFAQGLGPIEFSANDGITYYVYSPTGPVTLTGGKIYESTLALTVLLCSELSVDGSTAYISTTPTVSHGKMPLRYTKITRVTGQYLMGKCSFLGILGNT